MKSMLYRGSLGAVLAFASLCALAAEPLKIGVSGPFTGGSSSMGVSMRDGVRIAVDEINKRSEERRVGKEC